MESQSGIAHHPSPAFSRYLSVTCQEALILRWGLQRDDWSTTSLQLFHRSRPNIPSPHSAVYQSMWHWDRFGYLFTPTSRQPDVPELASRHNVGNTQQCFLHKPLESVYLSVGTHPYQQPSSNAQRREGCRGDGGEAFWKALICTQEHTWLRHWLTPHSLNTSVRWSGGGWLTSVGG